MSLQLFFNDLSVPSGAVHRNVAVGHLKSMVKTIRRAKAIDNDLVLNCGVPFSNLSMGDGVTLASIRNDGECVEESQYLKTLISRAPFAEAMAEGGLGDPEGFEYRLHPTAPISPDSLALALGLAHRLDGLAVSFPSHAFWEAPRVQLAMIQLDQNANLIGTDVEARNASSEAHVAQHEADLRLIIRPTFANGGELWARRAELLPFLEFIPRTRSQIESLGHGDPLLESVWRKLSGINEAIADWSRMNTAHPSFPFNVRGESTSRAVLTRFTTSDGTARLFSDHTDLAPSEGRLHFFIETNPRRHAIIGHVGRKLGIG